MVGLMTNAYLCAMETSYTPVDYAYREVIAEEIAKNTFGKIFYFSKTGVVDSAEGRIIRCDEISGKGLFIELDSKEKIRIDRIITLFGKPGAAYDEYDAFSNACMNCAGPHGAKEDDEQ